MDDKKNIRMLLVAGAVLLLAVYRLGSPFLKETEEMRVEAQEIEQNIIAVRQEAAMYGLGWEKTMGGREKTVMERLPDGLRSSDVLKYFLTDFEQRSPGRALFTSVNHQRVIESEFKSGEGKHAVRARAIRYKFKANLTQDRIVPYFEHLEKYPGLFHHGGYSLAVDGVKSQALEMELNLDLFLTPKEWVPSEKRNPEEDALEDSRLANKTWKEIFVSNSGGRSLASPLGKLPKFERIVGGNVVAEESLYEEGDLVSGWKILKIDQRKKTVLLKSGKVTKEVKIK